MKILDFDLDQYECILFDLDGTLIDSMPYHNEAWMKAFSDHGVTIDQKFLDETAGMASTRIVGIVNERFTKNLDPKELSAYKRNIYLENIDKVKPFTPVMDIVKKYHNKIPLGIVTGSSHAVVDFLLPKLEIAHYFDSIVCSDDTELGKDSIAPYELSKKHLNINLKNSLFLDDGDVGLRGAKLAGMDVIHLDIHHPAIYLKSF